MLDAREAVEFLLFEVPVVGVVHEGDLTCDPMAERSERRLQPLSRFGLGDHAAASADDDDVGELLEQSIGFDGEPLVQFENLMGETAAFQEVLRSLCDPIRGASTQQSHHQEEAERQMKLRSKAGRTHA